MTRRRIRSVSELMNARNWIFVGVAVVLGAMAAAFFTDWFVAAPIRIGSRIFPGRKGGDDRIVFYLDREYKLASIKVLIEATADSDPKAATMWHVAAATNSAPVTDFGYGEKIKGMKAPLGTDDAKPLKTGVQYRLLVAAGKKLGTFGFSLPNKPDAPAK